MIRRAVLDATGEEMSARGAEVMDCLAGVELIGPQKIRFEIDVESTAMEVRTGQWRFAEIVEGQALPDSFAECAASALGGNHSIAPRQNEAFPVFRGTISTIYRID